MKRKTKLLLLFVALTMGQAAAQANKKEATKPESRKTVYDFNEVDILGNIKRPEGTTVKERPETYFRRLLNLDENFLPNIVRSVEDF